MLSCSGSELHLESAAPSLAALRGARGLTSSMPAITPAYIKASEMFIEVTIALKSEILARIRAKTSCGSLMTPKISQLIRKCGRPEV